MNQNKTHTILNEILIIDDDRFIAEVISASFGVSTGFKVVSCTTGKEAFEYLDGHHPDIVILDLGLPDIDGIEMVRSVKASRLDATLPVIVLSGSDESHLKRDAFEAGAAAYLLKPFNPSKLRELVSELTA